MRGDGWLLVDAAAAPASSANALFLIRHFSFHKFSLGFLSYILLYVKLSSDFLKNSLHKNGRSRTNIWN